MDLLAQFALLEVRDLTVIGSWLVRAIAAGSSWWEYRGFDVADPNDGTRY